MTMTRIMLMPMVRMVFQKRSDKIGVKKPQGPEGAGFVGRPTDRPTDPAQPGR